MAQSAPRRTGRRFLRPARRGAARRKRTEQESLPAFQYERKQVDTPELLSRTLAGLEKLGSQRFPLRPYSDNFEMWTRNLSLMLAEFEAGYFSQPDQEFVGRKTQIIGDLRKGLDAKKQAEARSEGALRDAHAKLDQARRQLADSENEFKSAMGRFEVQRRKAVRSLKGQVEVLQKKKARARTSKGGLLAKLFRRAKTGDEVSLAREIESKTAEMRDASETLEHQMNKLKQKHAGELKSLKAQVEKLSAELEAKEAQSDVDDALEIRSVACAQLAELIKESAARTPIPNQE